MHYRKILREIFDNQSYLCLATANEEGKPWASPVAYVCDENFCLYFISYIGSQHAKNIRENKDVSISIYDSHQKLRNALGIQAAGKCEIIDEWHVPAELRQKLFDQVSLAVLSKEYAFFKITPIDIYLPDAERWKEFHDQRIRVEL